MFTDITAAADRDVRDHLGEPVIYRPAAGAPVPVTGIFDEQYVLEQGSSEMAVEGRHPAVFLLLADLPTDPELDTPTITIRGIDYSRKYSQPDGVGGILLVLGKAT
jgi:hypothetical protein